MREALAVMAGGALGSLARWLVAEWIARFPWSCHFPYSTLLVNVTGSFGIGLLSEWLIEGGLLGHGSAFRALIFIGILGGYTTFSSFSLQTLALLRSGYWLFAAMNVFLSVFFCLAAVWLGVVIVQWANGVPRAN